MSRFLWFTVYKYNCNRRIINPLTMTTTMMIMTGISVVWCVLCGEIVLLQTRLAWRRRQRARSTTPITSSIATAAADSVVTRSRMFAHARRLLALSFTSDAVPTPPIPTTEVLAALHCLQPSPAALSSVLLCSFLMLLTIVIQNLFPSS